MKNKNKLLKIVSLVFSILLFASCSEASLIESEITNFPTFELEDLVAVDLGSSFTPNAVATAGGVELDVKVSGDVDTNTVGIYNVTYSSTNKDGFDGMASQVVVVHDPSIVGTDVSGDIVDANNATRTGVISLISGTTSIFYATDFAFGGTFPMYFQMDGDTISEISQNYIFSVTSVDLTYDPITKFFTTVVNPYGFSYTFQYQ